MTKARRETRVMEFGSGALTTAQFLTSPGVATAAGEAVTQRLPPIPEDEIWNLKEARFLLGTAAAANDTSIRVRVNGVDQGPAVITVVGGAAANTETRGAVGVSVRFTDRITVSITFAAGAPANAYVRLVLERGLLVPVALA